MNALALLQVPFGFVLWKIERLKARLQDPNGKSKE
jgi:hypothetical protein